MGSGGKRKNAGRRKGSRSKATLEIKSILDSVVDFKVVAEKLYELSQGVEVQEKDNKGDDYVYSKAPDTNAAKILLEYRFGKPSQVVDLTSNGESLFEVLIGKHSQD